MKKLIHITLILSTMAGCINLSAQEKKIVKKRIVILHKGDSMPDLPDMPDLKDTIIIKMDIDSTIKKSVYKLSPIISNFEMNFGFANITPNSTKFNSGSTTGMPLPELKNGLTYGIGFCQNWGFNLIKGKLRLWTGLRYDITNYRFNNTNVRLSPNQNVFTYSMDTMNTTAKSKVVVNYLGVPLAFGYQSDPNHTDKGFWMRIGATAGYLVRVHSKVKLNNGKTTKDFDDFNFNDFALTPFVYVGYNSVAFYAKMTTTSLFKPNQGPEANAYQFGLVIQ